MTGMRQRRGWWGGMIALVFATACETPIRDDVWHEVTSGRFRMISNLPVHRAANIVADLERFHALVVATTNVEELDSTIPTDIVAFRYPWQFQQITRSRGIAGLFIPGLRSNLMLMGRPGRNEFDLAVMRHEYVHFVVSHATEYEAPHWYNEGFAEFMSTARQHGELMIVGEPPVIRLRNLREGAWYSTEAIISSVRTLSSQFYAQAWLLVHYLTINRESNVDISVALARYYELLRAYDDPARAFEEAFGEDLETLDETLRDMALGRSGPGIRRYGKRIDQLEFDRSPPRYRRLSVDEVAIWLGGVCIQFSDWECVRREAQVATEHAPRSARAHALLGDGYKFDDDWEPAEASFQRALELAPDDVLVRLDWGEYLVDRANETRNRRERSALLEEARAVFRKVLEERPDNAEAWLMVGYTHLAPGEDVSESLDPIERAFELLPSSPQVKRARVEALLVNDRREEAKWALERWLAVRHAGNEHFEAEESLDEILERRRERAKELGVKPDA